MQKSDTVKVENRKRYKYLIMKSACALLTKKTYTDVWKRGKKYAEDGHVEIVSMDDKHIEASVKGTGVYSVSLKFSGSGISNKCTCPYSYGACKHAVATAIIWDEKRGIASPDAGKVEAYTVPPSTISRANINKMFAKPLQADLQVLRTLVDEQGRWSRPHSKLPERPNFCDDENKPLDEEEIKKTSKEITAWARRPKYDPYFCAGEMVAAYCEVIKSIKKRLPVSEPLIVAAILLDAQKFHYKLVMQLIDSSDGLHVFTEAYLEDLAGALKKITIDKSAQPTLLSMTNKYEAHKNDY